MPTKSVSALLKFAQRILFLGFNGLLLSSNITQFPLALVDLIITKAGSNPVFTIGPFVEPLPVYEPNFEYSAFSAKQ